MSRSRRMTANWDAEPLQENDLLDKLTDRMADEIEHYNLETNMKNKYAEQLRSYGTNFSEAAMEIDVLTDMVDLYKSDMSEARKEGFVDAHEVFLAFKDEEKKRKKWKRKYLAGTEIKNEMQGAFPDYALEALKEAKRKMEYMLINGEWYEPEKTLENIDYALSMMAKKI